MGVCMQSDIEMVLDRICPLLALFCAQDLGLCAELVYWSLQNTSDSWLSNALGNE